jgi:hypothetical protein
VERKLELYSHTHGAPPPSVATKVLPRLGGLAVLGFNVNVRPPVLLLETAHVAGVKPA